MALATASTEKTTLHGAVVRNRFGDVAPVIRVLFPSLLSVYSVASFSVFMHFRFQRPKTKPEQWLSFGMRIFTLLVAVIAAQLGAQTAPPSVPREFRGLWVATVGNIDWPSKSGIGTWEAQREL